MLQGRNDEAAKYFRRAVDFLPERQTAYSTLGVFYFETSQTRQARETLDRYSKLFPHGGLNVNQIRQTLEDTSQAKQQPATTKILSAEERRQFLQTAQLAKLPAAVRRRRRNAAILTRGLQGVPGLQTPHVAPGVTSAFNLFTVRIEPEEMGMSGDEFQLVLAKRSIETAVHYPLPLHL